MRSFIAAQLLLLSLAAPIEANTHHHGDSRGFGKVPAFNRRQSNHHSRIYNSPDGGVSSSASTVVPVDERSSSSDAEGRFAVEYGAERHFVRAAQHAYLFEDGDDEEDRLSNLAPASNSRKVVPKKYSGLTNGDFSIA